MRWIFHVARAEDVSWGKDGRYAPASLASEGFIHASYKDVVEESARLYFPAGARLLVLAIDPRRLDVPLEVASTPRGPMPHVHGSIPSDAIRVIELDAVADHDDHVRGGTIGLLAWRGMTSLDLVGPLDALSRIATMGFDPKVVCDVAALVSDEPSDEGDAHGFLVHSACGLEVTARRYRPSLEAYDVLVVPGGQGARQLQDEPEIAEYLATFPANRLAASVCTGALLLGASGRLRGKRATTHASAKGELARHGASFVDERVVDEGQVVTAGGVTAGIDLGLHLVRRLAGDEAYEAIKRQMEVP